jgi:hypothetical protein
VHLFDRNEREPSGGYSRRSRESRGTNQIPAVAEPFFFGLNARVTLSPVMNAQDLANALPGIEKAVKEHGRAATA